MAEQIAIKGLKQKGVSAGDFESFITDAITEDFTSSKRKWLQGAAGNMSQAITKMLNGEGKPTSGVDSYNGLPVLHASSGKMGTSKSISFFYVIGEAHGTIRILGVGEHVNSTEYSLQWKDCAWTHAGSKVKLK